MQRRTQTVNNPFALSSKFALGEISSNGEMWTRLKRASEDKAEKRLDWHLAQAVRNRRDIARASAAAACADYTVVNPQTGELVATWRCRQHTCPICGERKRQERQRAVRDALDQLGEIEQYSLFSVVLHFGDIPEGQRAALRSRLRAVGKIAAHASAGQLRGKRIAVAGAWSREVCPSPLNEGEIHAHAHLALICNADVTEVDLSRSIKRRARRLASKLGLDASDLTVLIRPMFGGADGFARYVGYMSKGGIDHRHEDNEAIYEDLSADYCVAEETATRGQRCLSYFGFSLGEEGQRGATDDGTGRARGADQPVRWTWSEIKARGLTLWRWRSIDQHYYEVEEEPLSDLDSTTIEGQHGDVALRDDTVGGGA